MQPRKDIAVLARTENRVVRPRDFRDVYANPGGEFARLSRTGALTNLAHGYYVRIPDDQRSAYWQPEIEGVALGIAVADYGRDAVAVMGPSAARVLGALPRALATATVAVPRQRPAIETSAGRIQFVTRTVDRLDLQRVTTEITAGWVTTPEQTVLDLADRPTLSGIAPATAEEAVRALAPRCDPQLVARLAHAQHKVAAWQRFCWVVELPLTAPPTRRGVPTLGMNGGGDPADYGLEPSTP